MSAPFPKRIADWPHALHAQVEGARHTPFAWGSHDCCLWPARCIAAMTGRDPAAAYRGRYHDARSARRVLGRGNVETLLRRLCREFGFEEIPLAYAQRGDLVSTLTEHGPAGGIWLGHCAAFAGPNGLQFKPRAECRRAWRIP